MKSLKLIWLMPLLFLVACADDDGSSTHSDIKKAKSLAKTFDESNILHKGYMPVGNSLQVGQTLRQHGHSSNTYYQMHKIGCINEDGSKNLIRNTVLNTTELIVGTSNGKRADYIQQNEVGNCYWGSAQVNYGWNGSYNNKNYNFGRIDNCQSLSTNIVLKRIQKENLDEVYPAYSYRRSGYTSHNPRGGWNEDNYWDWRRPRPTYEVEEDSDYNKDSYFKLHTSSFGQQLSYYAPANHDRFAKLSGGRAVFVTRSLNPDACYKTVYYGESIDPRRPIVSESFLVRPEPPKD